MSSYLSTIILIFLAVFSYLVHNNTVTISILILLIIKFTPLAQFFPYIEKQGIQLGIVILVITVMCPLASGSLPAFSLLRSFTNWQSILTILVGIFVAWLGSRGVDFMSVQPSVVGGILIGTIIGVSCFHGIPVGPLIAAGIISLFFNAK